MRLQPRARRSSNSASALLHPSSLIRSSNAKRVVKHYTPSHQEYADEAPDEAPDKTTITDSQREALDRNDYRPVVEDQPDDRADVFMVPGEWAWVSRPRLIHPMQYAD